MAELKKGDIIKLNKEMEVYTPIPKWCFDDQHPYSKEQSVSKVELGREFGRRSHFDPFRERIYKMIKFVFAYFEMPVDRDELNKFLLSQVPNTKPNGFIIQPGEFEVIYIALLDDNREKRIYCKSLQQPEWTIYYLEESRYFRKYRNVEAIRNVALRQQKK